MALFDFSQEILGILPFEKPRHITEDLWSFV